MDTPSHVNKPKFQPKSLCKVCGAILHQISQTCWTDMEIEAKRGAGNGAGSLKVSAKVQFIAPGLVLFLSYLEKAELKR